MKTSFSRQLVAFGMAVVFLMSIGQALYAASEPNQLERQVEKAISLYYSQKFEIKVTDNGNVLIKGDVPVLYDRLRIFEIVSNVPGVHEIKDEVVVDTPIIADKAIEASLNAKLETNHAVSEPGKIKATVTNGVVFLTGDVHNYRDKLIANTLASWEKGAKGIEDDINVVSNANNARDDNQMEMALQDVLHNQFPHEQNVTVSVHDGVVTLEGKTRTLYTEDQIVKSLSGVIGVNKVISKLKLND